ncbi:MAG: aminotransferase class V-fold PLP-dependent enzyme [Atopobiaceae bacterium]|nr:aminotransferase class V-fold PLP-dependent enzyme [Atopobiaceae bacterium]
MANVTRRSALRAGGASMVGMAAMLMGMRGAQADEKPSSATSAAAGTAAGELKLNKAGLVDRSCFVGVDDKVELANADKAVAINFDNGATTPTLTTVLAAVEDALPMYGSIGRGKGQKSSLSTERFNAARDVVLRFFGADDGRYTCCFCGTTTDALNKIAGALVTNSDDVVLTTRSEHHANDLPWRSRATMRYVEVDELGRLKMDDFTEQLADGKVKVVSVQAASNVTGYVHDVHAIAKLAHDAGAVMVVDGAQIAAHRAFSLAGKKEAEDIDFFACSAHKMYAPFGGGCIVGKTELLNAYLPAYRGGGMVDVVTDADVTWLEAPDRWEAGSPNYLGQIAFATAIEAFEEVGFKAIEKHEQVLLRRAIDGLSAIDGVTVYADSDKIDDRVGVLTFNVDKVGAAEVAQYLADEHAIAVRQGEFCAHPLCHRLMGFTDEEILAERDKPGFEAPAMVRISFGMYNTEDEVDVLVQAISDLVG